MKTLMDINCISNRLRQNKWSVLAAFVSYPLYLLFNNLAYNMLSFLMFQDIHFSLFGRICSATAAADEKNTQVLFFSLFFIFRHSLIFLLMLRKNHIKITMYSYFVPINMLLMDGVSVFYFLIDNSFFSFTYFLSSSPLYSLCSKLNCISILFPSVNCMIGFYIISFLLMNKKIDYSSAWCNFIYLLLGVLFFTFVINLYFANTGSDY
jgi:hypothetical protein